MLSRAPAVIRESATRPRWVVQRKSTGGFDVSLPLPAIQYLDVRPEQIPDTLQALPAVLWRAEPHPGKKPAKVPYQIAEPEHRASSTDPATWSRFADAVEAYTLLDDARKADARCGPIVGLGVVLTAEAGITCLDLDHVLEGDTLDPRAARIVAHCRSWTERSSSGTGLHVFVRARVSQAIGSPEIEVYGDKRFIAITGHQWPGTPADLRDAQPYLDKLSQLARPEASRRPYIGPVTPSPDDLVGTLVARLAGWGVPHGLVKRWEDGYLVELAACPWADRHTAGRGGAAVMIRASGALDFICLHAHCAGRRWREFRAFMETARR